MSGTTTPTSTDDAAAVARIIRGRRSIRRYQPDDVPDALVHELLDLARHAPSSMNGQPWRFVVVRDAPTKRAIVRIKNAYCPPAKRAFTADFLGTAPVIIVTGVDTRCSGDREVENGVLATAVLLLAAHSRGLGSVYLSASRADEPRLAAEIRHLLHLPQEFQPVTIVPLGFPAETPPPKELRALDLTIADAPIPAAVSTGD